MPNWCIPRTKHHDECNPTPRADAGKGKIAWQLEEEVSGEEDPGADAVDAVAQVELLLHLERRKADVDAVEIIDDIE